MEKEGPSGKRLLAKGMSCAEEHKSGNVRFIGGNQGFGPADNTFPQRKEEKKEGKMEAGKREERRENTI